MCRATSPCWRTASRGTSWSVRPRSRTVASLLRSAALSLALTPLLRSSLLSCLQALRQGRQRRAGQLRKFPRSLGRSMRPASKPDGQELPLLFCFFVSTESKSFVPGQEVDRIIAQMMHAAEYLGWDVSELRPVSALIPASSLRVSGWGVGGVTCLSGASQPPRPQDLSHSVMSPNLNAHPLFFIMSGQ